MSFAVISCGCKNAWTVDLSAATSRCTRCGKSAQLKKRQRHWIGEAARDAAEAAGAIRAALAQGLSPTDVATATQGLITNQRPANHDSPMDAAAAKAREHTNQSDRAETVALWLTRLQGPSSESTMLEAMAKAGLSHERAEKEIVRMLACDVIFEPQAGSYASLSP